MPTQTVDAKNIASTITYGSVNGHYDLYPTQTVAASNYTAVKRPSTAAYDFYTGVVTSTTDVDNSNATTTTSYDNLGRPLTVTNPLGARTVSQYYDANRFVVVRSDLETIGDGRRVATQFYDQLGRVRLSKTIEDPYTQSAIDDTSGIKVQTRYMTYGGYNYTLASNPYRASYPSGETAATMGWTRTKVVNHGRQSQTETFSGATLPYPFLLTGYNSASTGIVSTDLDANRTLVTDQAQKQRISRTNGIGQLTDVWEIRGYDASTVSVTFPNTSIAYGYQTSYAYDTLNNLTSVTQGPTAMNRSFAYSSLSRLRTATNPESLTITYSYDANGNLKTKSDLRPVTITYDYDALNRVTQRSYNDSVTPPVTYTYDQYTNSKGKLTKVESLVSTAEYTEFDILGRVKASKQTTDGVTYGNGSSDCAMTYTYNLAGALEEQQYPSCRKVKNVFDASGDLSAVSSKKNTAAPYLNYASSMAYNAAGAMTSMQLGNGRWESTTFNSRLQPTQVALGSAQNGTDQLNLVYTYGTNSNNNGNVLSQTITVPGLAQPFVQNYTYDDLNRLASATETHSGWGTAFDRYNLPDKRFLYFNSQEGILVLSRTKGSLEYTDDIYFLPPESRQSGCIADSFDSNSGLAILNYFGVKKTAGDKFDFPPIQSGMFFEEDSKASRDSLIKEFADTLLKHPNSFGYILFYQKNGESSSNLLKRRQKLLDELQAQGIICSKLIFWSGTTGGLGGTSFLIVHQTYVLEQKLKPICKSPVRQP